MNAKQRKLLWILFGLILLTVLIPPWQKLGREQEVIYKPIFLGSPSQTETYYDRSGYYPYKLGATRLILEWGCILLLGGIATLALTDARPGVAITPLSEAEVKVKAEADEAKRVKRVAAMERRSAFWIKLEYLLVWPTGAAFVLACGFLPYRLIWHNEHVRQNQLFVLPLGYFIVSTEPSPVAFMPTQPFSEYWIIRDIADIRTFAREHFRPKRQYEILRDSLDAAILQTGPVTLLHDLPAAEFNRLPSDSNLRVKEIPFAADTATSTEAGLETKPHPRAPTDIQTPIGHTPGAGYVPDIQSTIASRQPVPAAPSQLDELQQSIRAYKEAHPALYPNGAAGPKPEPSTAAINKHRADSIWASPLEVKRRAIVDKIYSDSELFNHDSLKIEDSIVYSRMVTLLNAKVGIDIAPASIQIAIASLLLLIAIWARRSVRKKDELLSSD